MSRIASPILFGTNPLFPLTTNPLVCGSCQELFEKIRPLNIECLEAGNEYGGVCRNFDGVLTYGIAEARIRAPEPEAAACYSNKDHDVMTEIQEAKTSPLVTETRRLQGIRERRMWVVLFENHGIRSATGRGMQYAFEFWHLILRFGPHSRHFQAGFNQGTDLQGPNPALNITMIRRMSEETEWQQTKYAMIAVLIFFAKADNGYKVARLNYKFDRVSTRKPFPFNFLINPQNAYCS